MAESFTHDNSFFSYVGRGIDRASGKQFGWSGGQIRFKVSGTTTLKVYVDIVCPIDTEIWRVNLKLDGLDTEESSAIVDNEIFTGERSVTFTIPDTGQHDVVLCMAGKYGGRARAFWADTYKMIFASVDLDDGGSISSNIQLGDLRAACIGDSWMATTYDWVKFLDSDVYAITPIASGGHWSKTISDDIDFQYDGVAADALSVDVVILNSSVNDKTAGVTNEDYNTYITAAVGKVKVLFPGVPIFLIQSPDKSEALNYSVYGPEMSSIAAATDDVYYVPTTTIGALTWADNFHLDYAGQQAFASFVGDAVSTQLSGGLINSVSINGKTRFLTSNRLSGERVTTIYSGNTPYTYKLSGGVPLLTITPTKMAAYVTGESP